MTKRKDGKKTRLSLLNAACEVFAQKGYRDAKVSEICKRAGTNLALVNYYFGNKKQLYGEAWGHASQKTEGPPPASSATASAQDRLREYIHTLIRHFSEEGEGTLFNRMYLMELVNPSGLIQEAWHETIEPRRQELHGIIRELAEPGVSDLKIKFHEMSIINQCRVFVTIKGSDLEYLLGEPISPELIRKLSAHIADFSLAGIKAGNQIKLRR